MNTLNSILPLLVLATYCACAFSWSQRSPSSLFYSSYRKSFTVATRAKPTESDILDVEFERVIKTKKRVPETKTEKQEEETPLASKTLLDLSLDSDPQWKDVRIPFCQPGDEEYIDGKLAFTVDLEGITYGIAVPFDDAVAILVQENAGGDGGTISTKYIHPDDYDNDKDDTQELMEIMAVQVQDQLGEDLVLRKTPKVLTISGGLGELTDQWQEDLLPQPASIDDLLESANLDETSTSSSAVTTEDELSDFFDFMKKELGEEEVKKIMLEEPSEEEKALMKLFEAPMGGATDDSESMEDLMQSMLEDLNSSEKEGGTDDDDILEEAKQFEATPGVDGSTLKLIGFDFEDGSKSYSLVKLLQPYVLVGKFSGNFVEGDDTPDQAAESDIRFDLLTKEEEAVVIPKLEALCQSDLEAAGLTF